MGRAARIRTAAVHRRPRSRGTGLGLLLLAAAFPASAAPVPDIAAPRPFTAICAITETCHIDGGCASLPAPGEIIVAFDGTGTAMGQDEAALRPIDRFARLEDAMPLPRLGDTRRELLVDLPPDGSDRRFALFVQRPTDAEDPVLQPTYFILTCRDAAR